jgi:hypothetical protein
VKYYFQAFRDYADLNGRMGRKEFWVFTLINVIDTVDGAKLDAVKLESFVDKLPAMDMTKIVNAIDALNELIGLDNKLVVECSKCGGEVHTSFRFGSEFFRPSTI